MNQEIKPSPVQVVAPQQAPAGQVAPKPAGIKEFGRRFIQKIYQDKKIFWPIVVFFSLIVLIIIAGIIYRLTGERKAVVGQSPTPTPLIETVPPDEEKEPLDLAKEELDKLDVRIKDFDINQKRLTPPTVNFEVKF